MKEGYTILLLDDEESILKSLGRLLRQLKETTCLSTTDPYEAEELLRREDVDLIIADERMPRVRGHAFLAYVKERYPDTVRIIITGYHDPDIIEAAINRGEVYRFLRKPWDDEELLTTIRRALEHGRLEREHHRLEEELKQKNRELELMNSRLESRVQRRTAELEKTLRMLKESRDRAVDGFENSTNLLSSLIHLFQRDIGNHARRVAMLCDRLAPELEITGEAAKNLHMAAYFHEIGRVGNTAGEQSDSAREKYTEIGENIIGEGVGLKEVGKIIRHHREHFDGSGKPDGLAGEDIPLESRLLKAVSEYDWMVKRDRMKRSDALAFLMQHSSTLYDPKIIRTLHSALKEKGETTSRELELMDLKPGMELLSDIFLKDGVLFLPGKTLITQEIVDRIERFQGMISRESSCYVKPEGAKGEGDEG